MNSRRCKDSIACLQCSQSYQVWKSGATQSLIETSYEIREARLELAVARTSVMQPLHVIMMLVPFTQASCRIGIGVWGKIGAPVDTRAPRMWGSPMGVIVLWDQEHRRYLAGMVHRRPMW